MMIFTQPKKGLKRASQRAKQTIYQCLHNKQMKTLRHWQATGYHQHQSRLITRLLIIITLLGVTLNAHAAQHPRSLATDPRIKVVDFQLNQVVPIEANTFTVTQVQFSASERILDIQSGDLSAWMVTVDKNLPYMLFIKPTLTSSQTNMTVITNQHTYYFALTSHAPETLTASAFTSSTKHSANNTSTTYALHFNYPAMKQAQLNAQLAFRRQQHRALLNAPKNPKQYHWDYSFHGDKRLIPAQVFDDGTFTYLKLRPNQPISAIFAVDGKKGYEAVVNYRVDGHYIIIQRIAPQFTLRHGQNEVATIFNNRLIHHTGEGRHG